MASQSRIVVEVDAIFKKIKEKYVLECRDENEDENQPKNEKTDKKTKLDGAIEQLKKQIKENIIKKRYKKLEEFNFNAEESKGIRTRSRRGSGSVSTSKKIRTHDFNKIKKQVAQKSKDLNELTLKNLNEYEMLVQELIKLAQQAIKKEENENDEMEDETEKATPKLKNKMDKNEPVRFIQYCFIKDMLEKDHKGLELMISEYQQQLPQVVRTKKQTENEETKRIKEEENEKDENIENEQEKQQEKIDIKNEEKKHHDNNNNNTEENNKEEIDNKEDKMVDDKPQEEINEKEENIEKEAEKPMMDDQEEIEAPTEKEEEEKPMMDDQDAKPEDKKIITTEEEKEEDKMVDDKDETEEKPEDDIERTRKREDDAKTELETKALEPTSVKVKVEEEGKKKPTMVEFDESKLNDQGYYTEITTENAIGPYEQKEGSNIKFKHVVNDGSFDNLLALNAVKAIYGRQLPNMPKDYIAQLVFDPAHESHIAYIGKNPVGGITYKPFRERGFNEIAFVAVDASYQIKGCGTLMMNALKDYEQNRPDAIFRFLTFADNSAVRFFKKQGFSTDITMKSVRYDSYIKYYTEVTLMECCIRPGIHYPSVRKEIKEKQKQVLQRINHLVDTKRGPYEKIYPGLYFTENNVMYTKKGGSRVWELMDTPGLSQVANKELIHTPSEERRDTQRGIFRMIFNSLYKRVESKIFHASIADIEGYLDIVTDPIDMSIIDKRISNGFYRTDKMFQADWELMFDNCRKFNGPNSKFAKNHADKLHAAFENLMRRHGLWPKKSKKKD